MVIITGQGNLQASDSTISGVGTVTKAEILDLIEKIDELKDYKDVIDDALEKHQNDNFSSLSEFLDIGFSPEVVEVLNACTELIQLFLN